MYVERSGTVPQQDLTSVLSLANGPSVDAGADLCMEPTELRVMWGVTAMHGLSSLEAKARGLT